jgi:hypothetical protein
MGPGGTCAVQYVLIKINDFLVRNWIIWTGGVMRGSNGHEIPLYAALKA